MRPNCFVDRCNPARIKRRKLYRGSAWSNDASIEHLYNKGHIFLMFTWDEILRIIMCGVLISYLFIIRRIRRRIDEQRKQNFSKKVDFYRGKHKKKNDLEDIISR
jgi:hypothetical protein